MGESKLSDVSGACSLLKGLMCAVLASVLLNDAPLARAGDECEPHWAADTFCLPGLNGTVHAALAWDDGTGAALYVGGEFTIAGCAAGVANMARWDGSTWSSLAGQDGSGVNGGVRALAVYDDGTGPSLYVGGWFSAAGGVTAWGIARWDGANWSALVGPGGAGISSQVYALTVFDDGKGSSALYAGGWFATADGIATNHIARWDGSSWSALTGDSGIGVNNSVEAMLVFDDGTGPALIAGGTFTTAGGITANRIAKWNGSTWSALSGPGGNGLNEKVRTLQVFDDGTGTALYAGGDFTAAGGTSALRIARWDGSAWSPLIGPAGGNGVAGFVHAMIVFDSGAAESLYVSGLFHNVDGMMVSHIARWDGTTWSALSAPTGTGLGSVVNTLAVFDAGTGPALYCGGTFSSAGGIPAMRLARWDGQNWSAPTDPLSSHGLNGPVHALAVFDDGQGRSLYAGGDFLIAGGVLANRIARWDGSAWSTLEGTGAQGVSGQVYALTVFDDGSGPALLVGGRFAMAGGTVANSIARWDGSTWTALEDPGGIGVSSFSASAVVFALADFDDGSGPALYVGGGFSTAGGVIANSIARWDGTNWSALPGPGGIGVDSLVNALKVYDDGTTGPMLYVAGSFQTAGGLTANRIARWDGTNWSILLGPEGAPTNIMINALDAISHGTDLYAGGYFTTIQNTVLNSIARWDGATWSALEDSGGRGLRLGTFTGHALALAGFDDGRGQSLFVGGYFNTAGGLAALNIARWDGTSWSALPNREGNGVGGLPVLNSVDALQVFDDGTGPALFVGGSFAIADGTVSHSIAKWQGCAPTPPPCLADLNGDGVLDFFDVQMFLNLYANGNLAADFTGDGVLDFFDVQAFLNLYAAGCP